MANKLCFPIVIAGLFLVVGCQVQSKESQVVETMPAPNFSGPSMQDETAVARAIPAPAPALVAEPARSGSRPDKVLVPARPPTHDHVPSDWVPVAKLNAWHWIVIHHSATPTGGAAAFDKMHKAKGWDELGYHFVIGNGTDTHDGLVEVGSRWPKQKWGAHTKTPGEEFNMHGIGICLVGNFDVTHPTDAQMKSLSKLTSYLMKTYHISADHVVGHRDCKSTDCPGKYVNIAKIRQLSVQMLAAAGEAVPSDAKATLASGELLYEKSGSR
jgi:hypothetical protein